MAAGAALGAALARSEADGRARAAELGREQAEAVEGAAPGRRQGAQGSAAEAAVAAARAWDEAIPALRWRPRRLRRSCKGRRRRWRGFGVTLDADVGTLGRGPNVRH